MTIDICNGSLSLGLAPAVGGSVSYLRFGDRDILRPATRSGNNPPNVLQSSAFPMLPFTGRITDGQFQFAGKAITLPANMPPEPHAIHGFGWQSRWVVIEQTANWVEISHTGGGNAWPWPYMATQRFELSKTALSLGLTLTNIGTLPMPAGFGWHPYFPRQSAVLTTPTKRVWPLQADMTPLAPIPVDQKRDLSGGRMVDDLVLDDVFEGGTGPHTIRWPDLTLSMTADPVFGKLVVFVPSGGDYFCVEPATQTPDAVNSDLPHSLTGLHVLAPDETLVGTIKLSINEVA